jgi:hypothetical protein
LFPIDSPSAAREAFRQFGAMLSSLPDCSFSLFGDSFMDACLAIAESDPPASVACVAEMLLLGIRKCGAFADRLRAAPLSAFLPRFLDQPLVVSVFAKLCGHSAKLNREIVSAGVFDEIMGLPDDRLIRQKCQFCRHFFKTCDATALEPFACARDFLAGVFPGPDYKCFWYAVRGLSLALFHSPAAAFGYLRQTGFFDKLCRFIHSTDDVVAVSGCLKLLECSTAILELGRDESRRVFSIEAILSTFRFNDEGANLGACAVLVNLFASGACILSDFEDELMLALVNKFLVLGSWKARSSFIKVMHNMVRTATIDQMRAVLPREFLVEYFAVFAALNDPNLLGSLPRFVELALEFEDFDFSGLVECLEDFGGDPRAAVILGHLT